VTECRGNGTSSTTISGLVTTGIYQGSHPLVHELDKTPDGITQRCCTRRDTTGRDGAQDGGAWRLRRAPASSRSAPSSEDQIKRPRADLAARLEDAVRARRQPRIRERAKKQAATRTSVVIDTRARFGYTAAPGTTDDARLRHLTVALPPQYATRAARGSGLVVVVDQRGWPSAQKAGMDCSLSRLCCRAPSTASLSRS
jgi:hypothetical protein